MFTPPRALLSACLAALSATRPCAAASDRPGCPGPVIEADTGFRERFPDLLEQLRARLVEPGALVLQRRELPLRLGLLVEELHHLTERRERAVAPGLERFVEFLGRLPRVDERLHAEQHEDEREDRHPSEGDGRQFVFAERALGQAHDDPPDRREAPEQRDEHRDVHHVHAKVGLGLRDDAADQEDDADVGRDERGLRVVRQEPCDAERDQ